MDEVKKIVSVLMSTYNHEKYIAQAIESVVSKKTNFEFELVIGEDCSADGTKKIIEEYALKYPKLIRPVFIKENVGALRNIYEFALPRCEGKYIACLEGDDFWTNDSKLQKQVDFLEANPECGLTHADVNHYFEDGKKLMIAVNKNSNKTVPEGDVFEHLIKPEPFFIKTATTCFRKELLVKYFDYELAIRENWPLADLPLWMDISKHSKAHYFDEVFATYRLLNESASRTKSPQKHYQYVKDLYKIKILYLEKYKVDFSKVKLIKEKYYRTLLNYSMKVNDMDDFQEALTYLNSNKMKLGLKEKILVAIEFFKLNSLISGFYK